MHSTFMENLKNHANVLVNLFDPYSFTGIKMLHFHWPTTSGLFQSPKGGGCGVVSKIVSNILEHTTGGAHPEFGVFSFWGNFFLTI